MSDEYTPTTREVRENYALGSNPFRAQEMRENFDRWLDTLIPEEPTDELVEVLSWADGYRGIEETPDWMLDHYRLNVAPAVLAHLRAGVE